MQVNGYSPVQSTSFKGSTICANEAVNLESENDSFELSTKKLKKIGFFRILFSRLTKEQIAAINETKEIPDGAKIIERTSENGTKYPPRLTWNLLNITPGTQKLPAGYELKNDILGFTHLVREGTKSILYKD